MGDTVHVTDSFHLEIEGISAGSFVRCSGLGARWETIEVREGGSGRARRLRGDTRFENIVLERGVVRDPELYDWFVSGRRRDGAIVLLGSDGREAFRWTFERGWPCRWEGPSLDATRAEVAIEILEIVHEGLRCERR
jgi:phage tail-like protein